MACHSCGSIDRRQRRCMIRHGGRAAATAAPHRPLRAGVCRACTDTWHDKREAARDAS